MKSSGLLLAAFLLLNSPVLGHGGRYRGPMGEVPPGQRDPRDPQPPPDEPPRPIPVYDGLRVDGPPPMNFEHWLFWWHHNRDAILTEHLARLRREGGGPAQPPSRAMIERVILPALRKVAANRDMHADIRAGALIAEARAGGGPRFRERLFALLRKQGGEEKIVRESAALALALLGDRSEAVRDALIGVANDNSEPFRMRCFAMAALGLLRDASPEVNDCLARRLDGTEFTLDVPAAAILATGLIGNRSRVPELAGWLGEGKIGTFKLTDLHRSAIVTALGRIGDPAALPAVASRLSVKGHNTRRSAAIALGQLVPRLPGKRQLAHVGEIYRYHRVERDRFTRSLLLISLGRIGAAANAPPEVREACIRILTQEDLSRLERPWQALGLGLMGFGAESAAPKARRMRLADHVRPWLEGLRGDTERLGAFAISLGLLGDDRKETVELLLRILRDRGLARKLRGAAAVALGMLRHPDAMEPIHRAIAEREDRDLRVDTVLAAGLTGDRRFVEPIVKLLNDPKMSQFNYGSVALALGWIGDRSAVRPLLMVLEPGNPNGMYPDLTRAMVTVALGRLAMRGQTDPFDRISRDLNYRAATAFLDELLSIL